jgi:hypothetical protein
MGIKILASMQKKASEFMKDLKKKICNWWENFQSRHQLLIERLIVYLKYFVKFRFIPVYIFLFLIPIFFPTDANSARYMLSALVQSQAAIVAIVITLTLIAVQLTASAYSPRVINIFKKNPDMWILLGLYGISIFYSLILLRLLKEAEGGVMIQGVSWFLGHMHIFIRPSDHISPSFEWLVSLALWLGIFAFVSLVPYIRNITDLLKPENIINRLASDINGRKFLSSYLFSWSNASGNDSRRLLTFLKDDLDLGWAKNAEISKPDDKKIRIVNGENSAEIKINKEEKKASLTISGGGTYDLKVKDENGKLNLCFNLNEDPIQPIVDIIRGSIRKYDFETTRVGLEALTNQVINEIDPNCEENISDSFCTRLQGVGKLAASVTDEESSLEVIENLKKFGENTVSKQLEVATKKAITSLGTVGIAVARKETELEDVVTNVALALGTVGQTAVVKDLEKAAEEAVVSLGIVGQTAAGKREELGDAIERAAQSLEGIGKAAAEQKGEKFKAAIWKVVSSLGAVGKTAVRKGEKLEGPTVQVIQSLEAVGETAADNEELKGATELVAESLGVVGEAAVDKSLREAAEQIATSLGVVGVAAAGKSLKEAAEQAVKSLGVVGKAAVDKSLKDAAKETATSLGIVGKTAADNEEKELEGTTELAVQSLGVVGEAAADRSLKEAAEQAVKSLEVVGEAAARRGKKFEDAVKQTAMCLLAIGTIALERKEPKNAAKQAAKSLAKLTIATSEIVETTIYLYKLHLEVLDSTYFQKFMELYAVEREKMKAKA